MFDVGFSEILVIALVSCLMIDPKKLPSFIKEVRIFYKKFIKVRYEVLELIKNVDLDDVYNNDKVKKTLVKHIIGDDGNIYEAYDIDTLKKESKKDDGKDTSS